MTEARAPGPAAALFVLAHHDDEVFCAGHLRRALVAGRRVGVVWATAGGLASARRRRAEGARARLLLGLGPAAVRELGLPDQGAMDEIAGIARATESLLDSVAGGLEEGPAVVYVPAYEGGHPDHDAVNVAVALVRRRHTHVAALEFPLYRRARTGLSVQSRRPAPGTSAASFDVLRLDDEDLALRRRLACANASQLLPSLLPLRALAWAEGGGRAEPYRRLPDHDYARPPHHGALLYELYTRRRFRDFREHAVAALRRDAPGADRAALVGGFDGVKG